MLGKLMKYEIIAVGRVLAVVYGAFLASTVLFAFMIYADDSSVGTGVSGVLFAIMATTCIVATAILIIQRFYKNILGTEGYLTMTLPVSTRIHMINKVLSGAIWMIIGLAVAMLAVCIFMSIEINPADIIGELFTIISTMAKLFGVPYTILMCLEAIVFTLTFCALVVAKIYAAISIGHLWFKHRVLGAVGAYIGFSIIESVISSLTLDYTSAGIFTRLIFMVQDMEAGFGQIEAWFLIMWIPLLIMTLIYWFISYAVLERHLNLE